MKKKLITTSKWLRVIQGPLNFITYGSIRVSKCNKLKENYLKKSNNIHFRKINLVIKYQQRYIIFYSFFMEDASKFQNLKKVNSSLFNLKAFEVLQKKKKINCENFIFETKFLILFTHKQVI